MLDKKDIEIIKSVVDECLEVRLQPLEQDVAELKQDVAELKEDMVEVKQDVAELKQDVIVLKEDMVEVKQDVAELKQDVIVLKQDMAETKQDVEKVNQDVRNIKLLLENDVRPRLNTIEACYTSTYYRYAEGIEQLETMQTDIDILKETAAIHTEELQKLA